jgi:folate-binding protein YgfZ
MDNGWNLIELGDYGVLRLRGPDGTRFLQGQVSNDVGHLSAERSQLAGYHNPQGRAIALLRLVYLAADDLLALLPRELAALVATRLGKFILRSKVEITDESEKFSVKGLIAPHLQGQAPDTAAEHATSWAARQFEEASARAASSGESSLAAGQLEDEESVVPLPGTSALLLPDTVNGQSLSNRPANVAAASAADPTAIVRVGALPARWLIIGPAGEPTPLSGCTSGTREEWRLLDIADGMPQVYAATAEEFVAQMLNLDVLEAIAFDKGCYTGQEVIARAHYRGRVKRRMQRFMSRGPVRLAIGDSGQLTDGRTFKVVEVVQLSNGRCEFLAVAPMVSDADVLGQPGSAAHAASEVSRVGVAGPRSEGLVAAEGPPRQQSPANASGESGSAPAIDAEPLPLPYTLPD